MKKILFVLLVIPILSTSCFFAGERVQGNGNIKTEQRNVSAFDRVEVHGAINVFISQGDMQPVRLEGDENLLPYIEVIQQGGRIEIRTKDNANLKPTKELRAYLTAPEFRSIEVSGACDITGQNKISGSDLQLKVSGAGNINMEVDVPEVKTELSGSSEINLKGETKRFVLNTSGAAKAKCFGLLSEETSVDISGAGEAEVYASTKLDVEVSGAGNVTYRGEVKNINQHVSGAGSVRKAE
jgi:hypothetical protein